MEWKHSRFYEVARMHLDVALGGDTSIVFMNKASYDKLPPQAKAAIDKHSGIELSQLAGQATQKEWERGRNNVKETVSTLTPEQERQWKAILDPATQQWVQDTRDGAKVLDTFRTEIATIRK